MIHGSDRIALFSHGDGGKHFQRLLQAYGSHAYAHPSFAQCRGPRETAFGLTFGEGVGSPDRTDMTNSRCIVLIGSHIGENLHNSQVQTLMQALDQGATLITPNRKEAEKARKKTDDERQARLDAQEKARRDAEAAAAAYRQVLESETRLARCLPKSIRPCCRSFSCIQKS